jgi:heme oxygenase (biliverdin-IX-beta and delta-forming)
MHDEAKPRAARPISVREALRTATTPDHERIDSLYTRFDLSNPTHYKDFLRAQASAHIPVENALDAAGAALVLTDWHARKRASLLRDDLAETGAENFVPLPPPRFTSVPALLGAVYVVEGSRLGGAVLKRSLPPGAPARFLGAAPGPGSWRKLLAILEESVREPEHISAAIASARSVFRLFELAGLDVLGQE